MITGKFFITPHAVHRYIEHVRPEATYAQALEDLQYITSNGTSKGPYQGVKLTQQHPDKSLELWRGPRIGPHSQQNRRSRLRFVVGYANYGPLPQVVTVLPIPGKMLRPCQTKNEEQCSGPL